jgi:hypothetical protein
MRLVGRFWHDFGMSHSDRLFLNSNSRAGTMPRGGGGAPGARAERVARPERAWLQQASFATPLQGVPPEYLEPRLIETE